MHLVHRNWFVETLKLSAAAHPFAVEPLMPGLEDDRRRLRGLFALERERVGFVELVAAQSREQAVLVAHSDGCPRNEALPDARGGMWGEWVPRAIPAIEVPDDGNSFGIRRPNGEENSRDAAHGHGMGAQLLVQAEVAPLVEEVDIGRVEQADPQYRLGSGRQSLDRP